MASFEAKIGWRRSRKRENKNYRTVPYQLDAKQKIAKKFKTLKKTIMAAFQAKTDWKTLKKRENKNYRFVSFRSDPMRKKKFKIKQQKNLIT